MTDEPPLLDWGWIADNGDIIGDRLLEHVTLTVVAVAIGLAISLPLAILAFRHRRLYPPITSVAGILYTIPSLALFALLVPFTGLTKVTAEIGLVSYTLLILIRNVVAGLEAVPEELKEAARGMGYSERQLLWRVELPLALPVVLAGVRIATVTTVGLVTVTAVIGEGGLGYLLVTGFGGRLPETAVTVGLGLTFLLAVGSEALILGIQRVLMPWGSAREAAV